MMTQCISAKAFHPMRGHVEDGAEVLFSDGRRLTIKAGGVGGWNLVDTEGHVVAAADGAFDLTAQIVKLEAA